MPKTDPHIRSFGRHNVAKELFDISQDIGERNDLAKQRPPDTKKLRDRLEKYLASVDAQFPTPNPNFDPSKPDAPTKGNGDNGKKPKK